MLVVSMVVQSCKTDTFSASGYAVEPLSEPLTRGSLGKHVWFLDGGCGSRWLADMAQRRGKAARYPPTTYTARLNGFPSPP